MRKLDDYGFGSKPVGRPRKKRAKGKRGRKKAPVTAARAEKILRSSDVLEQPQQTPVAPEKKAKKPRASFCAGSRNWLDLQDAVANWTTKSGRFWDASCTSRNKYCAKVANETNITRAIAGCD